MNNTLQYCPTCGKPIWGPWLNAAARLTGAYCQCGSISVVKITTSNNTTAGMQRCPKCGWHVQPLFHTEANCEELREHDRQLLKPKPARQEVPRAFYDAFEDVEMEP